MKSVSDNESRFSDDPVSLVIRRLTDIEKLRQERFHPLTILLAKTNYEHGHGMKKNRIWKPVKLVQKALDYAFYSCLNTVEMTNRKYLIAVDISGSLFRFRNTF